MLWGTLLNKGFGYVITYLYYSDTGKMIFSIVAIFFLVATTFYEEEKDITKAYLLGANSYVRKPIDSEKFISVLQQIISYWGDINEIPMKQ